MKEVRVKQMTGGYTVECQKDSGAQTYEVIVELEKVIDKIKTFFSEGEAVLGAAPDSSAIIAEAKEENS